MFRSRKSSTISPLQPPASTDPSSKSMQSTPGQGQPQVQSPPPLLPLLPASQYAHGGRGQAQGFPPPQPAYAGDGIGRASSAGTGTGTGAAGAERVKEKRRSGFGWLGGKKKDKEKEEREKINVSIYNRDPFFGIVASDLGERGGCALRAMPLSVGIHGLGPVELFIRLFYFLLIYIYVYAEPSPPLVLFRRPPVYPVADTCRPRLCLPSVPPVPPAADAPTAPAPAPAATRNPAIRTAPAAVASARTAPARPVGKRGAGGPSVRGPAITQPRSRPHAAAAAGRVQEQQQQRAGERISARTAHTPFSLHADAAARTRHHAQWRLGLPPSGIVVCESAAA